MSSTGRRRFRRRIPPNYFAIAFGLGGLAEVWSAAGRPPLGVPPTVANVLSIMSAAVWLILMVGYLAQGRAQILADLRDPVLSPFLSLVFIVPMIPAAALATVALGAGQAIICISLAGTLLLGGWLTGQWVVQDFDLDRMHPGYLLLMVAGFLVGADVCAAVGLHALAEAAFGTGIISWLIIGSTALNRLFFRPALPGPLVPTLAIEAAPPAVAGIAYFGLTSGRIDLIAYGLGGYAALMMVAQLRFIPLYLRLRYTPGFWSFTFAYGVVAAYALEWITYARPAGSAGYAIAVIVLITGLIAAIAVRTILAIVRGQFFPAP